MKPSILCCIFFLSAIAAKSQIRKGQFLTGGQCSFETVKNEIADVSTFKTTNILLAPGIGYFVISNLAAGLRADISIYKQKAPNNLKQTFTSMLPFLRHYFLRPGQKVNVFSEISYIHSKSKFDDLTGGEYTQKARGYYISAGPAVFLNEHVALEFIVGYRHTKIKADGDNKTSTINSGLGLQVHLGELKARHKKTKSNRYK